MTETDILQECRLEAGNHGAVLFRNNVGKLKDTRGRWVNFGLCEGSADLIGWTHNGRFLAVEVKMPGKKPRSNQQQFIDQVNKSGGLAGVVTSANDLKNLLTSGTPCV